jgi:hypothetical protein
MFRLFLVFISIQFWNCAIFTSVSTSSQSSNSISTSVQSISTSLNSISSISSSLGSVSGSSSSKKDKEKDALYKRDVRDLTFLIVQSNQDSDFTHEIQTLAFRHGLSDWRNLESSFLGIGEGLKKAGIKDKEFSNIAKGISKYPKHFQLLLNGYMGSNISI